MLEFRAAAPARIFVGCHRAAGEPLGAHGTKEVCCRPDVPQGVISTPAWHSGTPRADNSRSGRPSTRCLPMSRSGMNG
jgi:hypothetical protein